MAYKNQKSTSGSTGNSFPASKAQLLPPAGPSAKKTLSIKPGKAATKSTSSSSEKRKRKCYCCNPYTLWCFRDYPTACIVIGIAVGIFFIFNRLYALPVTAEQPCPLSETSNCNAKGQMCNFYNPNDCEDSTMCGRIVDTIERNGRLEEDGEQMCGSSSICARCVCSDTNGGDCQREYNIQVTRCLNTSSSDLERMAIFLGYEFSLSQTFECQNITGELLEAALGPQHEKISAGLAMLILLVLGSVVYYLILLRGYSAFTGAPRIRWAFAGVFLKPKPGCLRQPRSRGVAPVLGVDLSIQTHYKDLFRHPWACPVCGFGSNDPGTEQCEVCRARNPNLPPALNRWVDTPLGKLTEGKLSGMSVAELERQVASLQSIQRARAGGIELESSEAQKDSSLQQLDNNSNVAGSAPDRARAGVGGGKQQSHNQKGKGEEAVEGEEETDFKRALEACAAEGARLNGRRPEVVQQKKPSKKELIATVLQLLDAEQSEHERGLAEAAVQRKAAELEQRRKRAHPKPPKFSGVALGPMVSLNGAVVGIFQHKHDPATSRFGIVSVLANRVWVRAKKEAQRARARLSHASAKIKSKVQQEAVKLTERMRAEAKKLGDKIGINPAGAAGAATADSKQSGQQSKKSSDFSGVNDTAAVGKEQNPIASQSPDHVNKGGGGAAPGEAPPSGAFTKKKVKQGGASSKSAKKQQHQQHLGCGISNARRFQQKGQYVFLRGDTPDRYNVTRIEVVDSLRFKKTKPFSYKAWETGRVELPRAAPTSWAAPSLSGDGKVAVFLSHVQIVRMGAKIAHSDDEDEDHDSNKQQQHQASALASNSDADASKRSSSSSSSDDTVIEDLEGQQQHVRSAVEMWLDGQVGPSGAEWVVATDPSSGHKYESHAVTGETKWIQPSQHHHHHPTNSQQKSKSSSGTTKTLSESGSHTTPDVGRDTGSPEANPAPPASSAKTANEERKPKTLPGERVVLRCVCNAVSTSGVGNYLWSTPLRSDPINVPDDVMAAEAKYIEHRLRETGSADLDETDDEHSPLRLFEADCLKWLQVPVFSGSGTTVLVRMHDSVRALVSPGVGSREVKQLQPEVHQPVVEICPDAKPVVCDNGRRAAVRSDASIIIWDVQAGGRTWSWHNQVCARELTAVDDEITALTGHVKAWEGGVLAARARSRPVVPDPGALQAFPFWAKIDKGDKAVSIVQIALRLEALKTRQRHLWPCPPVISGDGKVVAFRDQQSLYIVNASEPWEATKADDGTAADTNAFRAIIDLGALPITSADRQVGISRTGGLICVLVADGKQVHGYSADGGDPLWVHSTPSPIMGPTAPIVSRDGSIVALKLWETFVLLNGSDGAVELVGQTGDSSGAHQSLFERACCCLWRRSPKLWRSFVGTQEEHARGRSDGNMAVPGDGSCLVVKSRNNLLCFNVPEAYRANRRMLAPQE